MTKGKKDIWAEAEWMLGEIRSTTEKLRRQEADAEAALAAMRQKWTAQSQPYRERLRWLDKEIRNLITENRGEFFGESESARVELRNGYLQFEVFRYVKKARAVTPEKLEQLGYIEAVKIVKSVDWDALAVWPEWRLKEVGTERKTKEVYGYGVKEGN